MKKIETLIETHQLNEVIDKLKTIGIPMVNVTQTKHYSKNNTRIERYRGTEYITEYSMKLKIEILTNTEKYFENIVYPLIEITKNPEVTVAIIEQDIEISNNYFETFMNDVL